VEVKLDLCVKYKYATVTINQELLLSRGVEHNLDLIKSLHLTKLVLMDHMEETEDASTLRALAKSVTMTEFALQEAWGFERDIRYHRFWLLPKCSCPKMDNEDNYGTDFLLRDLTCILHGGF
jgi:hypothetical protein